MTLLQRTRLAADPIEHHLLSEVVVCVPFKGESILLLSLYAHFNNNIVVMSCLSVLFVEETRVTNKRDPNVVSSTPRQI